MPNGNTKNPKKNLCIFMINGYKHIPLSKGCIIPFFNDAWFLRVEIYFCLYRLLCILLISWKRK